MRVGHTIGKAAAWLAVIVALAITALVVLILTFDWNRARPWIDDKVSDAIGRPFAINGDLRVGWRRPVSEHGWRGWVPWPRFTAHNITIANPDWAHAKYFATLDAISFDVEALPVIAHRIVIPAIDLVNPSVDLERLKDGRVNWNFKLKASAQPRQWTLDLHDVAFARGNLGFNDQLKHIGVSVLIDTLGQPIPFGDALKQQEALARHESAQVVGQASQRKLAALAAGVASAPLVPASGAEAASRASAAASQAVAAAPRALAERSGAAATSTIPAAGPAPGALGTAASGASTGSAPAAASARPPGAPAGVGTYALSWTIRGTYKHSVVSGDGKVGNVLALQDAQRPFPIQANLRFGDTRLALVGTLTDPAHLAALDLRLWLAGTSMAHLYELTSLPLPETPPYATDGRLIGQFRKSGNVFKYENFTGRVGGSDLNGSVVYVSREPRPLLSGTLVSKLLQFSDLAPLIGADTNASKARRGDTVAQPANRVLPVEEFRTDRWKAIDADVRFTGRRIIKTASLPITDLSTHVVMQDGVLTLEPLKFGVAGGTLASSIHLDGSSKPLKGRFSLQARHLQLKQLFPTFAVMRTALGEINGDAVLSATGNSPAALAATSNGEVKTLITDGAVSRLMMEAAGLNVAQVVYEKLFGDHDVMIHCGAADFVATNGVLDSRVFALDTDDAVIEMDGNVNLRDETMHLTIHPHTKGFRFVSLRSPLYVKGTFKQPHVGVEAGALIARGGAAVGLGLLNPFASVIALLQPSRNQPLPCSQMLADMEKRPTAPPPGIRQRTKAVPAYMSAASAASGASAPAGREPANGANDGSVSPPGDAAIFKGS